MRRCGHPLAAHKAVRVLVQGALQAALRDAGLAWGAYEFLGALDRALKNPECEALWRQGEDVFADSGSTTLIPTTCPVAGRRARNVNAEVSAVLLAGQSLQIGHEFNQQPAHGPFKTDRSGECLRPWI